jgi:drug/metabolite transporter (DMT)-like permease
MTLYNIEHLSIKVKFRTMANQPVQNSPQSQIESPDHRIGYIYILLASLQFALMAMFVFMAHQTDQALPSLTTSFVRVCINLLVVVMFSCYRSSPRLLWGDGRRSLWWRGIFGAASLILSFAGIQAIGIADSSFLHCTNVIFIAALSPLILGQSNQRSIWIAVLIGLSGMYLLLQPRFEDLHSWGRLLSLGAGVGSAMAYLMVARAGRSNPAHTVIFYFCFIAMLMHLLLFSFVGVYWPKEPKVWGFMILAGIFATSAQHFMTIAYQKAPATKLALLGYSNPLFTLIISVIVFAKMPDTRALIGAAIILSMGLILKLSTANRSQLA